MSVDSTELLNRRHLSDAARDGGWLTQYPQVEAEAITETEGDAESDREGQTETETDCELTFDDVIVYAPPTSTREISDQPVDATASIDTNSRGGHRIHGGLLSQSELQSVSTMVVTYGNGVPTSLLAVEQLRRSGTLSATERAIVVDCPWYVQCAVTNTHTHVILH
jgi:hypothetical protein